MSFVSTHPACPCGGRQVERSHLGQRALNELSQEDGGVTS